MKKRIFTNFERYAIWKCREERCWLCEEPLSYKETTIDHFFPEILLTDDIKREKIFMEFGITDDNFKINGFENWLPCHMRCNQKKSYKIPKSVYGNIIVLNKLISTTKKIKQFIDGLTNDRKKSTVFTPLLIALERGTISNDDLIEFINPISHKIKIKLIPNDLILLEGGYWVLKKDIASEGLCKCENNHCVENKKKVYCYFSPKLSKWVIKKGLYYKCYDEIIICPRCNQKHKRGHIGKKNICKLPYINQDLQSD